MVVAWALLLLTHTAPLPGLGLGKPLGEYGQQAWQSDSGLPQNTVHAIAQTGDGYLWIGTEAGLVRFDGVEFTVFAAANTPALPSDWISCLKEDATGSLWIGTTGGLVRERDGVFTAYPTHSVLALARTRAGRLLALTSTGALAFDRERLEPIAGTERLGLSEGASTAVEDAQGRLWLGGLDAIASLDPGSDRTSAPVAIGSLGATHALAATSAGELWVAGANGLAVLRPGRPLERVARGRLPANEVTSLLPMADGGLWIGTGKGLAFCSHGGIRSVPELHGDRVQNLFLDRAGTLWVAGSAGLARIAHGNVDLSKRPPVPVGVLSIFEDREGSMWFGTETAGLYVLRDQPFSTVTTDDGLSAGLVRAVFEDHAGTIWIGTSGGGLDRLRDGRATPFAGRLPSKVILALAEAAPDHALWVGTPEGLARIRGSETRVFTTADGLVDDFVRSLYVDRDGSLWIGTRNGLSHYKDGVFRSYSRLDGLASDLVGTMLRTRDGTFWVGTLGGLSRMQGEGFQTVALEGGPAETATTALLEDRSGALWVGTNGRGLGLLRGGSIVPLAAGSLRGGSLSQTSVLQKGLPPTIYGMLEDAGGSLWLSSRTGVDRVSIAALHAALETGATPALIHYGSADGMRISEASGGGHPAAWRAHDGGLWFATLNGAAVVHPSPGMRNPQPPLPAIEQVLIDDQPVPESGANRSVRVTPGHGRLSIKYAGLSFVAPQSVLYRYRLEGFDKNWVEAGNRRTAFYTNIPPGAYRFLVRCANRDGVWSVQAAEQRLVVEPYFYQTRWFYAAIVLAVAALGYLVYHWRVLTVAGQYQAVLEERSRIAREIHDTLAQGYVAVAVQLEMVGHLLLSSPSAAAQQLKQTKDLVREGLEEARSSIWNLRTQGDAETLPSRLAAHLASIARRHPGGAALRFTVHGAYRPLARSVEEEVLRIAQEAVANAVAHARASTITVTLSYGAPWLTLRVVDDGVGMSANESERSRRGHFGLQGMRERAAGIEALLSIEGEPGAGVSVTLQVELERATRKEIS